MDIESTAFHRKGDNVRLKLTAKFLVASSFLFLVACGESPTSSDIATGDVDCAGVPGGTARVDACGDCVGGTTGLVGCVADCHGTFGGSASEDNCGQCAGGETGVSPCTADCNGDYFIDGDDAAFLIV